MRWAAEDSRRRVNMPNNVSSEFEVPLNTKLHVVVTVSQALVEEMKRFHVQEARLKRLLSTSPSASAHSIRQSTDL